MPNRKNWDQAAFAIWPALTAAATAGRTLTYSDLAPVIPTNPLSVGRALGPVQTYCIEANLPPLTGLVVSKTTGLPGNGFVAWDVYDLDDGLEGVFRYPWASLMNPFAGFAEGQTEAGFVSQLLNDPAEAADVYSRIKNRGVAQRVFRRALMEAYGHSCCMCGNSFESALEAAHIVPWGDCDGQQRMDVRNGILLCSTHHRMFDAAEITVNLEHKIEYFDPEGVAGPYSDIDRVLSIALHGGAIKPPANRTLLPDGKALKRRRAIDGWE
jgi:putative restriction endonuclease